jgi:hypothetical protein
VSGPRPDLGWHVISGELLLEALQRIEADEKADLVYAELWANSEQADASNADRELADKWQAAYYAEHVQADALREALRDGLIVFADTEWARAYAALVSGESREVSA